MANKKDQAEEGRVVIGVEVEVLGPEIVIPMLKKALKEKKKGPQMA